MNKTRGMTLLELLCVIAILLTLVAIATPVLCRAFRSSRAWIWGITAYNNDRIHAFVNDLPSADAYLTNQPKKWSTVRLAADGSFIIEQ